MSAVMNVVYQSVFVSGELKWKVSIYQYLFCTDSGFKQTE